MSNPSTSDWDAQLARAFKADDGPRIAPVIWRGLVVVGDSEGYLHVFSPLDGAVRGRERAARDPLMSVIVDAPQLLTLTVKGTLRAWDMKL